MKKIILSAALLLCGTAFAQKDTTYNRWSFDFGIGSVHTLTPQATLGYKSSFLNPISLRAGARYMFNNVVGLGWVVGYDNLKFTSSEETTHTNYLSSSIQGYVSLTNLYGFNEFTDKFGLLFHTGVGMSMLKANSRDIAFNFILGLTPQYHINNKFALNLDAGYNANIKQNNTWDMGTALSTPGFSASYLYGTVGFSYYLCETKAHADWTPRNSANKKELEALRVKLAATEAKLVDSDNDGVANFLDAEPNTPSGSVVNAKGQAIVDMDGDGILDSEDFCPTVKGTSEFKGCPFAFAQETKVVSTDDALGSDLTGDLKTKVAAVSKDVNFDTKSVSVKGAFKKELDALAKLLNENSSLVVALHGHCDNVGEDILNNQLSEDRAKSVKDYLVSKGVSASRISTKGFGITQPKLSNDTEKGRAANRRVELIVKMK